MRWRLRRSKTAIARRAAGVDNARITSDRDRPRFGLLASLRLTFRDRARLGLAKPAGRGLASDHSFGRGCVLLQLGRARTCSIGSSSRRSRQLGLSVRRSVLRIRPGLITRAPPSAGRGGREAPIVGRSVGPGTGGARCAPENARPRNSAPSLPGLMRSPDTSDDSVGGRADFRRGQERTRGLRARDHEVAEPMATTLRPA